MAAIWYAAMALNLGETDGVIQQLRSRNLGPTAQWLEGNRDKLYGQLAEDWKPFNGKTLESILNPASGLPSTILGQKKKQPYRSAAGLFAEITAEMDNIAIILESPIDILFVDVFALYVERYKRLAERLDGLLATSGRCCLVMPYGLSDESIRLLTEYGVIWKLVLGAYRQGSLHRVAVTLDDLTNIRNHVLNSQGASEGPDPGKIKQMTARFGEKQAVPRNFI